MDRKAWAERHLISHRAMQNVMDVRKQLTAQCKELGLLAPDGDSPAPSAASEERNATILQCLLRGFATNTARLMPDRGYQTLVGNLPVSIHPSSVLFGRKIEAIMFSEFVYTTKSYARCVSSVRLTWIPEAFGSA